VANTGDSNADLGPLQQKAKETGLAYFEISGEIESEIAELPEDERIQFSADYGLEQPARDRFLQNLYADLDLISFLTVGEDEVRAWTIKRDTLAPRAAGKIHSDLERGFIRAEVVFWKDLADAGNMADVKKAGKFKLEGKNYIVRDGDVVNILFNV
jgi:ribosome-binding ATPase